MRARFPTTISAMAVLILASCEDRGARFEADEMRSEIHALFDIQAEEVEINAVPGSVPIGMNPETFEIKQWPDFANDCLRARADNFSLLVQYISLAFRTDHTAAAAYGMQQSANLDAATERCGLQYGLKVSAAFRLRDGREMKFGQMLAAAEALAQRRAVSLKRYESSVESADRFWTGVGLALGAFAAGVGRAGAVNPSQVWVDPYSRSDGTTVRGHIRTAPNNTCLDNLRGCQ